MPKPQNIIVDVENSLMQINWPDGHASVYALTYLRRACPCAECQPWKEGVGKTGESPQAVARAVGELNVVGDVQPIGGYAIQFNWKDGHNFGIYDWEYLRDLCPCDECTAQAKQWRPRVD